MIERSFVTTKRHIALGLFLLAFSLSTPARIGAQETEPYDLLIRNGRIVDGAGNPWYRADIAVRGDRIDAIGRLGGAQANRVIDAKNHIVSPGFIDMHNHGRRGIFKVPTAENYVRQGVTSIIEGNDGGSRARPCKKGPSGLAQGCFTSPACLPRPRRWLR